MMDLSDGPATDGARMAIASGLIIEFDRARLEAEARKLAPAARVCQVDPVRWVLQGGEEHGMIAAFPPHVELPEGFRVVGAARALRDGEEPCALFDGRVVRGAWDHFSSESVD